MSENPDLMEDTVSDTPVLSRLDDEVAILRLGAETPGPWRRVATKQTMYDGTVLPTWGVQGSTTQQWVGRAHPVGPSRDDRAESYANAGLFAASKEMAVLLKEAAEYASAQFDETDPDSLEVSGGDLVDWFAQWRLRVKQALAPLSVRLPKD